MSVSHHFLPLTGLLLRPSGCQPTALRSLRPGTARICSIRGEQTITFKELGLLLSHLFCPLDCVLIAKETRGGSQEAKTVWKK